MIGLKLGFNKDFKEFIKEKGLFLGLFWLLSLFLVGTVVLITSGPSALLVYLGCKVSGVCPI